jgi:hypothetical protein
MAPAEQLNCPKISDKNIGDLQGSPRERPITQSLRSALDMPPKRIDNPTLNDHATAIGYLCFMYNGLEVRVDNLLGTLAGLQDSDLECFTNQFDLLKKLPTLKALAFQKKPSQLWFDDIELMSWATSSHIIPKRNRFVHDIWLAQSSGAIRRHQRIKIGKPQSHQPASLTTYEHIPTTADEIWQLVQETKDVSNILRHLYAATRLAGQRLNRKRHFHSSIGINGVLVESRHLRISYPVSFHCDADHSDRLTNTLL